MHSAIKPGLSFYLKVSLVLKAVNKFVLASGEVHIILSAIELKTLRAFRAISSLMKNAVPCSLV